MNFDPSLPPQRSQLEGELPHAGSVVAGEQYPGLTNDHFWIWNRNNCAPATFLTMMELTCLRVSGSVSDTSLLGTVLSSRVDVPKAYATYSSSPDVFDKFHRQFAGHVPGGCLVTSHGTQPLTGCCAYGSYSSYDGFLEKLPVMLEGNAPLHRCFTMNRKRTSRSQAKTVLARGNWQ